MIQTIGENEFRKAFEWHGRDTQFSYEALTVIFDYYEQYEDDTGEQVNLDVVAICCDLSELTPVEFRKQYDVPKNVSLKEYLCDRAAYVGETESTVIFVQF